MELDDDLAELGEWVHGTRPLVELLDRVSSIGRGLIEGADVVSVVLVSDEDDTTIGSTDDVGRRLDERQREVGRGPCLDAAYGGSPIVVDDFATDTRWPDYSPTALKLGIRSSMSAPLPIQEHILGAVDWYGREPSAFTNEDVDLARDFAARVAVLVTNAHLYGSVQRMAQVMQSAMASRAVIEQAKGVIMATTGCDADGAFHTLVQQSQHENRKLRDLAQELVERQLR